MNNSITTLSSNVQSAINDVQARLEATHTQIADGKKPLSKQEASVVARLSNQATSQDAVQSNINNANNIIDVTQTGLSSISSILSQMQGLATQVSNGLFNSVDQSNLFTAFANLNSQIGKIATSTSLNGNNLLSGDQTVSVVSGTDGVNNQTTVIQGIDITRLQTALKNLSFAVSAKNLSPITSVTGALPAGSGSTNAEQTISFNRLALGDSATVGGLIFTANTDLTGTQVATIFAQKIGSSINSATGSFTGNFQGGYAVADNSGGMLTFTATSPGLNSIAVSGNLSSAATPLISSDVAIQQIGVSPVTGVSPQQRVTLQRLNAGDTATIGTLTFTAASDLTAAEVAAIFANKTAAVSPSDPSASIGSFTGSLSNFNGSNIGGSAVLSLTGTSQVPTGAVSVGGNVISRVALSSSNVSIIAPGSSGTPGVYAQQTVNLSDLDAGNSATIGGLTFTARTNLTATELATIFANRITAGRDADSSLGAFSGTFIGGFTGESAGNTLNLIGTSFGPMATVTASEMVSGAANAPQAIALISQFLSQISSTQASLSAASGNLNTAFDGSTKIATSSQKTVDEIQNIDLTALQANLQALSVQQSLDFQVISQMNAAASSLLSIFR